MSSLEKFEIKFNINEKILCQTSDSWNTWKAGIVKERIVSLISVGVNGGCQEDISFVCELADGDLISVSATDSHIRPLNFEVGNHLQVLVHHLKYNASAEMLEEITEYFGLNLKFIGSKLLLAAAACDNTKAFKWLVCDNGVDVWTIDSKQRSILQIAIVNKQERFVDFVVGTLSSDENEQHNTTLAQLLSNRDSSGKNLFHYIVTSNCEELLERLTRSDSKCLESLFDAGDPLPVHQSAHPLHICSMQDSQKRSPIDYAVILKRSRLSELLTTFRTRAELHNCLRFVTYSMSNAINQAEVCRTFDSASLISF